VRPDQPARALATRPPLRRLLWAVQRLKSGKSLRATDLAREFEVAVRTAYRDLDFLRDEWRVPLEYDHHQGTYHLTEPVGSLPLVSLSQGELLAIYFAEKVLRQYRGTALRAGPRERLRPLLRRASTPISPWTWGRSPRPMPRSSARS
jgi:predicted DNA-binding transcriptional regulator YafY